MIEPAQRPHRCNIRAVSAPGVKLGGGSPLFLIAGPCVIEDEGICREIIGEATRVCREHGVTYIFKASYDKSNKTIQGSYRGPGWQQGLAALDRIKSASGVLVTTDVHEREQCGPAAEVADILQIPMQLSKQIDLIVAAAETGKIVNIKKAVFTAPWEMNNVLSRLAERNLHDVMVTERGYMFGYQTLVNDMRSLQVMSRYGKPVVFDASHSVHGNQAMTGDTGLKQRDFIRPLVRSAVANGVDGIFVEIHPRPDQARSDAAGTLALAELNALVRDAVAIDAALSASERVS